MKISSSTGVLLVLGSFGVFIPYTILAIIFDYPAILRLDAGEILTRFHAGGNALIAVWWAFALLGLPLLVACLQLARLFPAHQRWFTTVGTIGLVVQLVGLLRWPLVVPVLAKYYLTGDAATQQASRVVFTAFHQFGGVLLGEHVGQLFTIAWTAALAQASYQRQMIGQGLRAWGWVASFIYLLAQSELVATVVPGFPEVPLAGFVGSTLWLAWLMAVGMVLWRRSSRTQ